MQLLTEEVDISLTLPQSILRCLLMKTPSVLLPVTTCPEININSGGSNPFLYSFKQLSLNSLHLFITSAR